MSEPLNLVVKEGVTSIGDNAFSTEFGSIRIEKANLPDSIMRIGCYSGLSCYDGAFLPADLKVLDEGALLWASFPEEGIYVPEGVTSLGDRALYDCKYSYGEQIGTLKAAYFSGDAPTTFGQEVFFNFDGFTIYYVPGTSGWTDSDAYDAAAGTWNGYKLAPWEGEPEELKLVSCYPEHQANNVSITYENPLEITMTFNKAVESVQADKGLVSNHPGD